MAKRQKREAASVVRRTTKEEITPVDPLEPADEHAYSPDLLQVLSQLRADGGYVVLKKRRGDSGKYDYIKRYEPSDFSIDAIADLYGGGDYLICVYDADNVLVQSQHHGVDPRIKGQLDRAAAVGPGGELGAIIAMMQAQATAANERFEKLLTLLVDKQPTEEKLIDKLKAMREIVAPSGSGNPGLPVEAMVTMFKAGIDLVRDTKEGVEHGSGSFMELGEKVLTQLAEKMLLRGPAPTPPTVPTPVLPAPSPATPATEPVPANGTEADPMSLVKGFVKGHLDGLLHQAKRASDPELYADVMLDNCPPAFYAKALEYLNRPALVDELIAMKPDIAGVRAWFEALQLHLVAGLEAALAPAVDAARPDVAGGSD